MTNDIQLILFILMAFGIGLQITRSWYARNYWKRFTKDQRVVSAFDNHIQTERLYARDMPGITRAPFPSRAYDSFAYDSFGRRASDESTHAMLDSF